MLVIKNYVIDEDKIHAQIEENKKRPEKKKSKFRQRMDDAMKQAQEQQAQQKKSRKQKAMPFDNYKKTETKQFRFFLFLDFSTSFYFARNDNKLSS